MRVSVFLVIALILAVFQLTSLSYFRLFGVSPDLFLVCVFIASLFFKLRWSIIFSVLLGIFKDSFSPDTFGLNIILFSLWSFLIVQVSRKITIDDNITRALLLFIVALLQNIISGLLLFYSGGNVPTGIFLRIVFLGSLYTALTLPLILKIVKIRL